MLVTASVVLNTYTLRQTLLCHDTEKFTYTRFVSLSVIAVPLPHVTTLRTLQPFAQSTTPSSLDHPFLIQQIIPHPAFLVLPKLVYYSAHNLSFVPHPNSVPYISLHGRKLLRIQFV